jgi:predicted nucleic acid-binding protein
MPPVRRVWDSCTIINYLAGRQVAADCQFIINQAERGELEIVVSAFAEAEVVKLDGELQQDSEELIREFFGRNYIIRAALDIPVAALVRELVRNNKGLKPYDAIHIATALHHKIPILETYDERMIKLGSGKSGSLPLIIRNPTFEGMRPLL